MPPTEDRTYTTTIHATKNRQVNIPAKLLTILGVPSKKGHRLFKTGYLIHLQIKLPRSKTWSDPFIRLLTNKYVSIPTDYREYKNGATIEVKLIKASTFDM